MQLPVRRGEPVRANFTSAGGKPLIGAEVPLMIKLVALTRAIEHPFGRQGGALPHSLSKTFHAEADKRAAPLGFSVSC
jgi:hypothetical protein